MTFIPTAQLHDQPEPRTLRRPQSIHLGRRWASTFLAFPPSGLAAITAVNRVDDTATALLGGLIAGIGIGATQAVALRPVWQERTRSHTIAWIVGTAIAAAIGTALGAGTVDYATGLRSLALMGAITGSLIGSLQALLLASAKVLVGWRAALWAPTTSALWALGWTVTTIAGVDIERQYAVFGATGALTSTVLGGIVLAGLARPTRDPHYTLEPLG